MEVTRTIRGTLTPCRTLQGVLSSRDTVSGILTVPKEVDGKTHGSFLMHDWDFTAGLVDRVQGRIATPGNGAVRKADGIRFASTKDYVTLDAVFDYNRTYEIDFGETKYSSNYDENCRVFMVTPEMGFIYKMNGVWGIFGQNAVTGDYEWKLADGLTAPDLLSGSTLKIVVDIAGFIFVYVGNTLVLTGENIRLPKQGSIMLGSVNWQSFYQMNIKSFRIYYKGVLG